MSRFRIDRVGQLFPTGESRGLKIAAAALTLGAAAAAGTFGWRRHARSRQAEPTFVPDSMPEQFSDSGAPAVEVTGATPADAPQATEATALPEPEQVQPPELGPHDQPPAAQ